MLIPREDIIRSLAAENPWWKTEVIPAYFNDMPRRSYFEPFYKLVANWNIRRAVILMGPRRVGKSVLARHLVQRLIDDGIQPTSILYVSIDTPTYTDCSLQFFIDLQAEIFGFNEETPRYIIFDEIQYLIAWERHLKVLVDHQQKIRFVASGSAAAALRLKSNESGAGRFTDFMLPPLTFYEYMQFTNKAYLIEDTVDFENEELTLKTPPDFDQINSEFLKYINYGGYPEAVFNKDIQDDPTRFIKNDIIDKVLLRDLPSLYGLTNVQELNRLFMTLAHQTGQEVSIDKLSQNSGVSKPTISKYIEYLEAAFLIFRLKRVDNIGKKFTRDVTFKVYLTNPSIRSALFAPLDESNPTFGHLVETAIISQWLHREKLSDLYYARWKRSGTAKGEFGDHGEIDLVYVHSELGPNWLVEVKWSDRSFSRPNDIESVREFLSKNETLDDALITSKTKFDTIQVGNVSVDVQPAALYSYELGRNLMKIIREKY